MKTQILRELQQIWGFSLFLALIIAIFLLGRPAFAAGGVQVVVPTHDIARGTTVQPGDFTYITMPAGSVQPGLLQSVKAVSGKVSRRALQAGRPVRGHDFRLAVLVKRGAIVTMTYNVPGIHLTATMRAIRAGGLGETVIVQNPTSFKQVGAIVTGPGEVRAIQTPVTQISRAGAQ